MYVSMPNLKPKQSAETLLFAEISIEIFRTLFSISSVTEKSIPSSEKAPVL